MGVACSMCGEKGGAYMASVEIPEEKNHLEI